MFGKAESAKSSAPTFQKFITFSSKNIGVLGDLAQLLPPSSPVPHGFGLARSLTCIGMNFKFIRVDLKIIQFKYFRGFSFRTVFNNTRAILGKREGCPTASSRADP